MVPNMNNRNMTLNIITPKSCPMKIEVGKVFLPGIEGCFEILNGHAPLIAELGSGEIVWDTDGRFTIGGGFAEVCNNVITVVAYQ